MVASILARSAGVMPCWSKLRAGHGHPLYSHYFSVVCEDDDTCRDLTMECPLDKCGNLSLHKMLHFSTFLQRMAVVLQLEKARFRMSQLYGFRPSPWSCEQG